jgi:hypothetical protein
VELHIPQCVAGGLGVGGVEGFVCNMLINRACHADCPAPAAAAAAA